MGIMRLDFDANYKAYFSDKNPQLAAFERFQRIYSQNENILVVLEPLSGEVFDARILQKVVELTEIFWQVPYSRRVDSISNFQHSYAVEDELIVENLVSDVEHFSNDKIQRIKSIALSEPLLVNRLISANGHVTAINISLQLPPYATPAVKQAVEYVYKEMDRFKAANKDIRVYLSGGLIMDYAFPEATFHDITTLVPVVFIVIAFMMFVLMRSISGMLVIVTVISLSSLTGMGMAGWLGIRLTPPSIGAITIIMTLAVADSIHLISTYFVFLRKGFSVNDAVNRSLSMNAKPVFLTSLTTVIGFLSMNYSDAPPFRDLGNITAIGITAAYVYSIALLPLLLIIFEVKTRTQGIKRTRFFEWLSRLVFRRQRLFFNGMLIMTVLLALFIPRIELNDQFVEYFDPVIPFRADTDFVMHNLTGIYMMEYSLHSGHGNGIYDTDYLQKLERFRIWFEQQPETVHVSTFTYILKRLNQNMHQDDKTWYQLPDTHNLAAQLLLLFEMSLPYGLDLNDQINVDKSASRFSVIVRNISTREFRDLEMRARDWLNNNAPELQTDATGASVMFAYISERNIRTMMLGTGIALILIALTISVALKSLKIGLISLVPNIVPATLAFGVWALFVGQVGLVISVVFAMALGIIVDDTVHFIHNYRKAIKEDGMNAEQAINFSFVNVGEAISITSLVLIVGFMLLSLSAFRLNAATGQLTSLIIGFALVADLLFLPPLLLRTTKDTFQPVSPTEHTL